MGKDKKRQKKNKSGYIKPDIKSYAIKELSKGWNFEVFGICIPVSSGPSPTECCPAP